MKAFLLKYKRIWIDIAVLFAVFLFVFISYFIFKPLYFRDAIGVGSTDGIIPRIFIYICLVAVITTGVILKIKNKLLRFIQKSPVDEKDLNLSSDAELLEDYRGHRLLVFSSPWAIDFTVRRNPGLELSETLDA